MSEEFVNDDAARQFAKDDGQDGLKEARKVRVRNGKAICPICERDMPRDHICLNEDEDVVYEAFVCWHCEQAIPIRKLDDADSSD